MSEPTGPRVMLLGSGELSRELTTALRHLGAEVTAVNDDVADADPPGVSAELARLEPDFVVTVTDNISDETLGAVEAIEAALAGTDEEFTELVPSARSVRLTTDREGLRRLAADELGLPTAPFWFVGSVGELKEVAVHAGFPLLLKPAGAARQRQVVAGPDDIELAWHLAVGQGTAPLRVLAETAVDIEFEVSLLAVRTDGPAGPVIEFCAPIGHHGAAGVLESWQPQELSPAATDAAKSVAARIVKALGGRGVFSVELMINGDEVYFADVTACPHPSAWVTLRSQRLSAFELQARAILGLPVDTMMVSPGAARVLISRCRRAERRRADRCAWSAGKRCPRVGCSKNGGTGYRTGYRNSTRPCPTSRGRAECARLTRVSYAGDITPLEAWKLLSDNPQAVLVDVRTDAEWRFVGVPDLSSLGRKVVYIEWNTSDGRRNENFLTELQDQIPSGQGERPVVFLCRSGNRSIGAAEVATEAGIAPSYNVLDGFEGQLDAHGHRGETGWRAVGLPWKQG